MDELELKERAGKFVFQLYSNNRKTLIELFEAAFTRMADYKARAERAEAERDDLRAQLDAMHRKASNLELELEQSERQRREISDMADKMADKWTLQVEQLRAELDAARAELGTLRKRINIVMNQAAIQCDDGNWNYSDYMRGLANGLLLAKSDLDNSPYLPLARPERWLEEVAGRQWRPNDDQALFEDKDIEGEIILTATFQQRNHCWNVDGISILPSGVVAWRPRTAAPDEEE